MNRNSWLAVFVLVLFCWACGGDSEGEHDHHDHHDHDHDMTDTDGMCTGEATLTSGDLTFTLTFEPTMVPMNALFAITVTVTDTNGQAVDGTLTFNATMPDHGHGMNVQPTIEAGTEPGTFVIEGVNFHMPGTWKIDISLESDGTTTAATVDYECSEG